MKVHKEGNPACSEGIAAIGLVLNAVTRDGITVLYIDAVMCVICGNALNKLEAIQGGAVGINRYNKRPEYIKRSIDSL
jgi:hypothetical protein